MSNEGLRWFALEVAQMAEITSSFGWDKEFLADDGELQIDATAANPKSLGARPIPRGDWTRMLRIAIELANAYRWLPVPELHAHQDGHASLLWSRGTRHLPRLELHVFDVGQRKDMHGLVFHQEHSFEWTQTTDLGATSHTSNRLRDVAEAIDAVLRPAVLS